MLEQIGKENMQSTYTKREVSAGLDAMNLHSNQLFGDAFEATEKTLPKLRNILSDQVTNLPTAYSGPVSSVKAQPDSNLFSYTEKELDIKPNLDSYFGLPSFEVARKYGSLFSCDEKHFESIMRMNIADSTVVDPITKGGLDNPWMGGLSNDIDTSANWDMRTGPKVENIQYSDLQNQQLDDAFKQFDEFLTSQRCDRIDPAFAPKNIDSGLSNFDERFFSEICGRNSGELKNVLGSETNNYYNNQNGFSFDNSMNNDTSIPSYDTVNDIFPGDFADFQQLGQYNCEFLQGNNLPDVHMNSSKQKKSKRKFRRRDVPPFDGKQEELDYYSSLSFRDNTECDSPSSGYICGCRYEKCVHVCEAKRMRHNKIERERRGDMRRSFDRIVELIPELREMPPNRRSKLRILQTTVKYINNYLNTKAFQLSLLVRKRDLINEINSLLQARNIKVPTN